MRIFFLSLFTTNALMSLRRGVERGEINKFWQIDWGINKAPSDGGGDDGTRSSFKCCFVAPPIN